MSRFTWAIVFGVLGLIVVSLILAVTVRDREPTPDLTTPGGVTLAFVQSIQRGEAERAWDQLARAAQARTSRDQFLIRANNARSTYDRARMSIENERSEGDMARVDVVRTYPGSGGPFGAGSSSRQVSTVRLVREPEGWRIETPPDPFLFLLDR